MDRRRFSTIAHAQHEFAAPIASVRARELLRVAGVCPGSRVLDIGAGFGGWAALAVEMGAEVVAFEPNPEFVARGRALGPRVKWMDCNYDAELVANGIFDAVLLIGASHALGGLEAGLPEIDRMLKSGGRALIGDGYWQRDPDAAYLDVLGATPEEMPTLTALCESVPRIAYLTTSTTAEWDHYEGLYRSTMLAWLADNASDPDAEDFRRHSDRWFEAYWRYGRDTLGFAWLVVEAS
jgi:SAM-dependent methyltransferase